jgi:diguanylate cyclase (GGDEF)-like protein
MNLAESLDELEKALQQVVAAARSDDKTPLRNALALRESALELESTGKLEAVVFGDLNAFKELNDKHGHQAGDGALSFVGEMIQEWVVGECQGQAFRPSGDEFVILLSLQSLEDFKQLAFLFQECAFPFEDKSLKTAMSFGYAVGHDEDDVVTLLKKAEAACQQAKAKGDGICEAWTSELDEGITDADRQKCVNCKATIKYSVPKSNWAGKLLACPCCGHDF